MSTDICKLKECLINEKIIKYIRSDEQFFKFKLEDGVELSIGGDRTVKAIAIVTKGKLDNINMVIEKVDYVRISKQTIITINDDLILTFDSNLDSYIYITFGNTILCKLK